MDILEDIDKALNNLESLNIDKNVINNTRDKLYKQIRMEEE